jgi:pimeloyl-ACP methyl ester carboxylesterase|nr:alpha/beta fold hydrolase [Kofleriaceae bacterium]
MTRDASQNSTIVRNQASATAMRLVRAGVQVAFAVSDDLGSAVAEKLFTSPRRYERPERERVTLARARPFEIDVELTAPRWRGRPRARVAAWRWGFGPTVLLVHGWAGRGAQLGELVEPLCEAGLSVVAFDAPAHGDSPGSRLYLTDLADCIAGAVAAAGPIAAIVAHSFGGAATLLALARARRAAAAGLPHGWPERVVAIAPNAIILDAFSKYASMVGLDAAELAAFERRLAENSGLAAGEVSLDALVDGGHGELLVLHDRDDRDVPVSHGERLAAAWPGAELVTTAGLGHTRILRDPATIARAVTFVRAGIAPPASDLVREVERLAAADRDHA